MYKGSCGSGVEPVSCYWKVAGSIPFICMPKCPWARHWTPNCSWCADRHLSWQPPSSVYVWITVSRFGQKRLLTALKSKYSLSAMFFFISCCGLWRWRRWFRRSCWGCHGHFECHKAYKNIFFCDGHIFSVSLAKTLMVILTQQCLNMSEYVATKRCRRSN